MVEIRGTSYPIILTCRQCLKEITPEKDSDAGHGRVALWDCVDDPATAQAGYVYVRIDNWGGELGLTYELVFGAEIHTPNPAGVHAVAISRGAQIGWYTIVEEGKRFFLLEAHNRPGLTVKVWRCGYHYYRETPNSRPEKRAGVRGLRRMPRAGWPSDGVTPVLAQAANPPFSLRRSRTQSATRSG